ncbi:hypothetical protein NDU88_003871 [Pleurodeles waltl]|uniref:Uncharacterized protein n=1 Tax=Pleurodeles waltl TaxID=8319 RepID=A0AAV7T5X3_PLEWA|nr:hypothetical protein NDU88_003871 [Pleurodeles waltl]
MKGHGHRLKLPSWVRAAGRIQNPDNTPAVCTASVFQGGRGRARDRGLSSSVVPCRQLRTRVGDHIKDWPGGWIAGAPAIGAIVGSSSTGPRVRVPATAPALDVAGGRQCGRIHAHNRSREACVAESCRAGARLNQCTRGRPGGWATVVSPQPGWTGTALHFGPRVGGHFDVWLRGWTAGTPATEAIGGSTSTVPSVWAPAAAPELDAVCGLPDLHPQL